MSQCLAHPDLNSTTPQQLVFSFSGRECQHLTYNRIKLTPVAVYPVVVICSCTASGTRWTPDQVSVLAARGVATWFYMFCDMAVYSVATKSRHDELGCHDAGWSEPEAQAAALHTTAVASLLHVVVILYMFASSHLHLRASTQTDGRMISSPAPAGPWYGGLRRRQLHQQQ